MRLDWSFDEMSSAACAAWHSARAPRVVEWTISMLILLQALAIWRDVQSVPVSASEAPNSSSTRPRFSASDLSQLLGAHLFGESPSAVASAAPAIAPSAFKLVGLYVPKDDGVVAVDDVAFEPARAEEGDTEPLEWARMFFGENLRPAASPGAIAWLSLSGAPAQRVQIGEPIGGGTVREIRDEGVTLDFAGRRVRIAYPQNPYVAMFRGDSAQPKRIVLMADMGGSSSGPALLRSRMLMLQPALNEQGIVGFRVQPGADEGAFTRSGLKPGDVITAIAGLTVVEPEATFPLLQAINDNQAIEVTVQRDGRVFLITLGGKVKSVSPPSAAPAIPSQQSQGAYRSGPETGPSWRSELRPLGRKSTAGDRPHA